MRTIACLLATAALLPAVDVDSADNLLRLQVAGWWAAPGGDGIDAPGGGDVADRLDAAPALLAEATLDLPLPVLPAISAGFTLWEDDRDGLEGTASDAWAALTYSIDVLDYAGIELGAGAHVAALSFSEGGAEVDEDDLIPAVVAGAFVHPIEALEARASLHVGRLGDAEVLAAQAQATWYALDHLGVAAGWRWYQAAVEIEGGTAELSLNGPYAGLVLVF
ncbi:MAG: hypothetical protein RLZZ127_2680 [Planctomycetota bacterium]|jgi:hypothetical protein